MGMSPPTNADLREIARRYHLRLHESDLDSFRGLVTAALISFDVVEALYRAARPVPPARQHRRPDAHENPLGAWYVRTDLSHSVDGPLAGRTVAVKDNIEVAGVPMANGSQAVEGFVPALDATVVSRVLDAGATITGKAVCEDLCFSAGSHTSACGPVRNPWDRDRMSGGSSSGCAALVAAGEVDLAIGGDQGGSIRIPAAFCGVVGHKPTHGLVPYTGAFPIEATLDHLGPITATTRDAALLLTVLAGPDGQDPRQDPDPRPRDYLDGLDADVAGLRVGVLDEGFGLPGLSDPDVDRAVLAATRVLAEIGASVRRVSVPWHRHGQHLWSVIATEGATAQMIDGNAYGMNWVGRYDPELIAHYGQGRLDHADALSEVVKFVVLGGRYSIERYHGRYYAMARNLAPTLADAYDRALAEVDVLVMPTVPCLPQRFPCGAGGREEQVARALELIPNTAPFDVTGHPAISVPAGLVDGLPVGLMIVAPRHADHLCLRLAHAYETAVGGFPAPALGQPAMATD